MILRLKMAVFDRNNMDYNHLEWKVKPSLQAYVSNGLPASNFLHENAL